MACNKRFNSTNSYETHLLSKKHKERQLAADKAPQQSKTAKQPSANLCPAAPTTNSTLTTTAATTHAATQNPQDEHTHQSSDDTSASAQAPGQDAMETSPSKPEAIKLELEDCIFCTHRSESLLENMKHMSHKHGFFVPDVDYLIDLSALISYLQVKVSEYHMCLLCNGKGRAFYSLEAARGHMCTKGHCFVEYEEEGQLELEEFYDFRSRCMFATRVSPTLRYVRWVVDKGLGCQKCGSRVCACPPPPVLQSGS